MKIRSVYQKTLYDHHVAIIAWGLGIIIISLFYASIYPSISGSSFTDAIQGMSSNLINAFIGSADFFSTPNGFIHGEFFTFTMPLIVCIITILVGSGLIAREEETGTMELLLSRPISRRRLMRHKAAALVTIVGILAACVWVGLWVGSLLIPKFAITLSLMAIASVNLGLLALAFGCIALMITAIKSRRSLAAGITGIYFLVSYIVGTFGEQVSWLRHGEPLSLFHYFRTMDILQKHTHWWDLVVLLAVCAVAYSIAEYAFSHRDTGE